MQNEETQKALEMTKKLDKVSKAFCMVRWKHATVNFGAGATKSCCHHAFKPLDPKAFRKGYQLHDNSKERRERMRMLVGSRVSSCDYCWWIEDKGHMSDRQLWSAKNWMAPYFEETAKKYSPDAETPSWLELNFSSLCNLKCSYCSPIFSSKWYKEIKDFGPYPTLIPHNDSRYINHIEYQSDFDNSALMQEFWQWFAQIYPGLKLLKITGGEPLLTPHTFKLLDIIKKQKATPLSLALNSNLCPPEEQWQKFIRAINEIEEQKVVSEIYLHPSIDTWGARAEYIRYGLDFEAFRRHAEEFLTQTRANIFFICTLNNLALAGLEEFWRYLLYLKQNFHKDGRVISITTEVLLSPSWQNISILPSYFKTYLEDTIRFVENNITNDPRGFGTAELMGLQKALSVMDNSSNEAVQHKRDFFRFFSEYDRRRQTNLLQVFPELENFWRECEQLEQNQTEFTTATESSSLAHP